MATGLGGVIPAGVTLSAPQVQFLAWLRTFNPAAYHYALQQANTSTARSSRSMLAGLGSWWDSLTSAVSSIGGDVASAAKTALPALLQYQTQRKVLNMQIERANRGLPPLSTSQLQLPAFQVQVAPSPQVTASIGNAISAGTRKTWEYVAGAVLLVGGVWLATRRR